MDSMHVECRQGGVMENASLRLISAVLALAAGLEIKLTKLQKSFDELKRLIEKSNERAPN
jgi:hypothetical protein